ncbi:MAG TPA: 1-acyl-sn-glycerol-3-phosphate acyltransferase [Actinocrinis sp.]|nr:1-acyl-sn-glycerol-3-phosphate acyltransferase [Actinocrinis sp.]
MSIRTLLRHPIPRRTVTITLLALFIGITVLVLPVVVLVTLPFALVPGAKARPIRFGAFLVVYLVAEVVGLLSAVWLWLRLGVWIRENKDSVSGLSAGATSSLSSAADRNELRRQRYQDANYALLARMLTWLYAAGAKAFGLRVQVPEIIGRGDLETQEPVAAILGDEPLLVLSRHAGPGDSFLLVHALLVYARRRPLIVLKDTLAFDPLIDVALSRVPHCFITPRHALKQQPGEADGQTGGRTGGQEPPAQPMPAGSTLMTLGTLSTPAQEDMAASIGRMAAGMGPADALLVFPEGANFTAGRRQRIIERLRHQGHSRAALHAQRLRNVLPPHPNGVFAAIDAAPDASLVFVAHTGLDHMQSVADVWHGVPLDRPASVTWWTLPASRVPAQPQARLAWLQENWAQVDTWISREQAALEP